MNCTPFRKDMNSYQKKEKRGLDGGKTTTDAHFWQFYVVFIFISCQFSGKFFCLVIFICFSVKVCTFFVLFYFVLNIQLFILKERLFFTGKYIHPCPELSMPPDYPWCCFGSSELEIIWLITTWKRRIEKWKYNVQRKK